MLANVLEKPATVENPLREVSKISSRVSDAVEDGVRSASQAIRHGRDAAEDAIEEAKHTVKQRPLQAMGTVFAAGVLAGTFLTWIGFRRRWVQAQKALQGRLLRSRRDGEDCVRGVPPRSMQKTWERKGCLRVRLLEPIQVSVPKVLPGTGEGPDDMGHVERPERHLWMLWLLL